MASQFRVWGPCVRHRQPTGSAANRVLVGRLPELARRWRRVSVEPIEDHIADPTRPVIGDVPLYGLWKIARLVQRERPFQVGWFGNLPASQPEEIRPGDLAERGHESVGVRVIGRSDQAGRRRD